MSTLEHPITQVPGLTSERLQVAVQIPLNPQWYRDMVRLNPTLATHAAIGQVLGDEADAGAFDAVWMLLALRAGQAGFAFTTRPGRGGRLASAMMQVHDQRGQHHDATEILLDAFRREILRGERARTLTHIRKRLIDARQILSSQQRGGTLNLLPERIVRDVYTALHPDREVRAEFVRFMLTEHYRAQVAAEHLRAQDQREAESI
ncbi:hypothetical protein [Nocardiopsis sp. JB363]|uniref:hypothetical protein n=1 Tax=Nocardiopsis sp. JB363 TaxID=1434837 RepID=UPI00097AF4F7|nr:hypothetical protein [Nocardiopsis sp. JB363]SIO86458.1 hypothetical protein BQ8420_12105 [Nocardiopsis sp. JB363]